MIDASMSHAKLDILKKAVQVILDKVPQESYLLIGVSTSTGFDWLTPEPTKNSSSHKEQLSSVIKENLETECADYPMDISAALLASLEMDMGPQNNLPRTVIILSNGTICNKLEVESLLTKSLKCHNSRVSAIGIGNGSSDSFLRTIAAKGLGLYDTLTGTSHIEDKLELFLKRLRLPTISNVTFDTKGQNNILMILPVLDTNQYLVKGLPIEIFVYLKDKLQPVEGNKKAYTQQIIMNYDDLEGKKTPQSLIIALSPCPDQIGNLARDFHKVIVNRLLMSVDELKFHGKDKPFVETYGQDWATRVALEHQILTSYTSFLAVAEPLPKGFDIMNDDLSVLRNEGNVARGETKVIKPVLGSDVTNSYKSGLVEKDFSNARFHKKNYSKLSNRMSKSHSDNELRTRSSSRISSIPQLSDNSSDIQTNDSINDAEIYHSIMEDRGPGEQAPDNFNLGAGRATRSPERIKPSPDKRVNIPKTPMWDGLELIEESDEEGHRSRSESPKDVIQKPIKEITIEPSKPLNPENLPEFLSKAQLTDGSWELNETNLTELGLTEDQIQVTATTLGIDTISVLVILCMTYVENQKYMKIFKNGMVFLTKMKKLKYSDFSKQISSAHRSN